MRALVQRVSEARVTVGDAVTGSIGRGYLVFLGVKTDDTIDDAGYLASRVAALRIFNDAEGKMNLSLRDVGGAVLAVSQFTLHADTRKGNRPSYVHAAEPELAERLYEAFVSGLRAALGKERVATGAFRAMMQVALVNDGPVTVMLQSKSERQD
jgi:D-aminoacyl-tRNA deacylase